MKKFFTLAAISLMAIGAYAQDEGSTTEVDKWNVYYQTDDGTVTYKDEYETNTDGIITFSTAKVTGTHISGPVSGYADGPDRPLPEKIDCSWGEYNNDGEFDALKSVPLSADGSIAPFYYVQGKGNPVNLELIEWEEIITNDVPTGNYRAYWENAYYQPDGSKGLPTNGTYVTLTPSVDGTFTVAAWINKGDREIYVVKESDMKALSFAEGEITASGYIGKIVYGEDDTADSNLIGYPMYQEEINTLDEDGNDTWIMPESANHTVEAYLTFDAEANETYYIFNKSTQIGFSGFEFEYEDDGTGDTDSITEVIVKEDDPNAPIYNLAGQRVTKNAKGILIQNGKKFIAK